MSNLLKDSSFRFKGWVILAGFAVVIILLLRSSSSIKLENDPLAKIIRRSYLITEGSWIPLDQNLGIVDMYQNYPPFDSRLVEKQKRYALRMFNIFDSEILSQTKACREEKVESKKIRELLANQKTRLLGAQSFNRLVKRCFEKLIDQDFQVPQKSSSQLASIVKASSRTELPSFKFKIIPPGSFLMAGPRKKAGVFYNEQPHFVTITASFEIMTYELTQKEWFDVMGFNPSLFSTKLDCPENHIDLGIIQLCPKRPVENVSWLDVQSFIQILNLRSKSTKYRLPTEAEWEYAARGNTDDEYFFKDFKNINKYVWWIKNSNSMTQDVGKLSPNNFGLFDMFGNASEIVQDYYGILSKQDTVDPKGPQVGTFRVVRGFSWMEYAETPIEELVMRVKNIKCDRCVANPKAFFEFFRSSTRYGVKEDYRFSDMGFRLVREKI